MASQFGDYKKMFLIVENYLGGDLNVPPVLPPESSVFQIPSSKTILDIFSQPLCINSFTINSVFICQAKHHGFLSPTKATSGDILDLCLGRLYFNGSTMITKTDGDITAAAMWVAPY
jgi:hypothetical protein